jgi:hypothetical protein
LLKSADGAVVARRVIVVNMEGRNSQSKNKESGCADAGGQFSHGSTSFEWSHLFKS